MINTKSKFAKALAAIMAAVLLTGALPLAATAESPLQFEENDYGQIVVADCDENAEGTIAIPAEYEGRAVELINENAFADCEKIEKIIVPGSVKKIGTLAFEGCALLNEITLNEGLEEMHNRIFDGCTSLRKVVVPASVKYIFAAFQGAESLEEIEVADGNRMFSSIDGVLFYNTETELIAYPCAKAGDSYTIPNTVKTIVTFAFSSANLKELTIPSSVERFKEYAFYNQVKIERIRIEGNPNLYDNTFNFDPIIVCEKFSQIHHRALQCGYSVETYKGEKTTANFFYYLLKCSPLYAFIEGIIGYLDLLF